MAASSARRAWIPWSPNSASADLGDAVRRRVPARAIAARNAQPGIRPLRFRIGINIGDVIVEGDNLYGDGVNAQIAARLESIAHPGSICVSAKGVYDEVRRKLSDISFINGGAQKLKNIEDPGRHLPHVGPAGASEAARHRRRRQSRQFRQSRWSPCRR